jgi:hypothetical protein
MGWMPLIIENKQLQCLAFQSLTKMYEISWFLLLPDFPVCLTVRHTTISSSENMPGFSAISRPTVQLDQFTPELHILSPRLYYLKCGWTTGIYCTCRGMSMLSQFSASFMQWLLKPLYSIDLHILITDFLLVLDWNCCALTVQDARCRMRCTSKELIS